MALCTKIELLNLQKTLKTDDAIAKKFKVTRQAVFQLRTKYDIPSVLVNNPARNQEMKKLFAAGKTIAEIAKKYDLSISQTYKIIDEKSAKVKKGKGKKK